MVGAGAVGINLEDGLRDPDLHARKIAAALYLDAGASGIFVPGPADEAVIGALAEGIKGPLNIMLRPTTPAAQHLAALGVRRLSSATAPFRAAYGALVEALPGYLETGTFYSFAGRGALPDLDAVFGAR